MVDPITGTVVTLAIQQLGPPIVKETGKAAQKNIQMLSDFIDKDNKLTPTQKTMAMSAIILPIASEVITMTVGEGIIKGVQRYIDS